MVASSLGLGRGRGFNLVKCGPFPGDDGTSAIVVLCWMLTLDFGSILVKHASARRQVKLVEGIFEGKLIL